MEITPEVQAQLDEQKKQCIFCKIISKEQESKIVFEDDLAMAVLDIFPAVKGHTALFLKEHYPIMPYIPADQFKHLFGIIPGMCKAIQSAMLTTGSNVFIANGGPAGQRAPHFLIHLLPRDSGDNFNHFEFKKGETLGEKEISMLSNNLPIMMKNHFGRNPASWHIGTGDVPDFLSEIYNRDNVVYEDEKALCVLPQESVVPGHMVIYPKMEKSNVENLSLEDGAHISYVASFAATAVFEGLGAHGTNIIFKSGISDDNPGGQLAIHILPRMQDDDLQDLMWESTQPSYDLDQIANKIKDKTWKVSYKEENKDPSKKTFVAPEVLVISDNKKKNPTDEIRNAINHIQK